jgi:hypothetical protein
VSERRGKSGTLAQHSLRLKARSFFLTSISIRQYHFSRITLKLNRKPSLGIACFTGFCFSAPPGLETRLVLKPHLAAADNHKTPLRGCHGRLEDGAEWLGACREKEMSW